MFLLVAAAVIPSLVIMFWFHRRDVNPEPQGVLWKTLGWGVLTVIPVIIVVKTYAGFIHGQESYMMKGTLQAFLGAAVPEEFFKFLVVFFYASRHREFDEPMDGIVYGVAASLGFATLENIMYVLGGGLGVALLRAFSSVPAHAIFGAIMGVYVGRARFNPGRKALYLGLALFWPILLHGLYDLPLLSAAAAQEMGYWDEFNGLWLVIVPGVMLFGTIWVLRLVRKLRAEQLRAQG